MGIVTNGNVKVETLKNRETTINTLILLNKSIQEVEAYRPFVSIQVEIKHSDI